MSTMMETTPWWEIGYPEAEQTETLCNIRTIDTKGKVERKDLYVDEDETCARWTTVESRKTRRTRKRAEACKRGIKTKDKVETINKVKPIITIEPEGINRIAGEGQWEEIELSVDSGATESVVPDNMPQSIPTRPGAAHKRGVQYEVANGERIPNEGEKRFQAWTEEGQEKRMVMQVCEVNQGLLSVSKAVAAGNRIIFDKEGSYIVSKASGKATKLEEKNGMYVLKLWVQRHF